MGQGGPRPTPTLKIIIFNRYIYILEYEIILYI